MTLKMAAYPDFEELQEKEPPAGSAFDVCPLTLVSHPMSHPHACGKNANTLKLSCADCMTIGFCDIAKEADREHYDVYDHDIETFPFRRWLYNRMESHEKEYANRTTEHQSQAEVAPVTVSTMHKAPRKKLLDDNAWLKNGKDTTRKALPPIRTSVAVNGILNASSAPSSKPAFKYNFARFLKPEFRINIEETKQSNMEAMELNSSRISTRTSTSTLDRKEAQEDVAVIAKAESPDVTNAPASGTKEGSSTVVKDSDCSMKPISRLSYEGVEFHPSRLYQHQHTSNEASSHNTQSPLGQQPQLGMGYHQVPYHASTTPLNALDEASHHNTQTPLGQQPQLGTGHHLIPRLAFMTLSYAIDESSHHTTQLPLGQQPQFNMGYHLVPCLASTTPLNSPNEASHHSTQSPLSQQPHFPANFSHSCAIGSSFQTPAQSYHAYAQAPTNQQCHPMDNRSGTADSPSNRSHIAQSHPLGSNTSAIVGDSSLDRDVRVGPKSKGGVADEIDVLERIVTEHLMCQNVNPHLDKVKWDTQFMKYANDPSVTIKTAADFLFDNSHKLDDIFATLRQRLTLKYKKPNDSGKLMLRPDLRGDATINYTDIYVTNIAPPVTANHLKRAFRIFGETGEITLQGFDAKEGRRCATISYVEPSSARKACLLMCDYPLGGRQVRVHYRRTYFGDNQAPQSNQEDFNTSPMSPDGIDTLQEPYDEVHEQRSLLKASSPLTNNDIEG
ncbi:hypothetical protein BDZ45DRAFT_772907 [Acephala macrosclerotiorum]|nr:hypothetical protein BDZ45DRAFT_772907 [Acephala macrosclerotiorum]